MHLSREQLAGHLAEFRIPGRQQRLHGLASAGQELHWKFGQHAALLGTARNKWALVRRRAVRAHGHGGACPAVHHAVQRRGGLGDGREFDFNRARYILLGDQAVVIAHALQHELTVHMGQHHAIHRHPRVSQDQRLKAHVEDVHRLDAGRGLHFDGASRAGPSA